MLTRQLSLLGLSLAVCLASACASMESQREPGASLGAGSEGDGSDSTADALVGEIPFFDTEDERAIYVDLAPRGQPSFVLLLDTGAEDSIVTPRMARRMGVSVRAHRSSPYRKKTRLGRDLQFWVDTRGSDTAAEKGWEYGLLGARFLDDYVVEIDYPGRVVRFWDPRRYAVPEASSDPKERVIPFTRAGARILVEYELNGQRARAMLDTGAGMPGLLSVKAVENAGYTFDALDEGVLIQSVMGVRPSRYFRTDGFVFGDFVFEEAAFNVLPVMHNLGGPSGSLLGHDVLKHFIVTIDYPRRRILLERHSDEGLVAMPAWLELGG